MAKHCRAVRVAVRAVAVSAVVAGLSALAAGPASADPIVCPPGQTSTQVAPSEWQCVNNGGNTSNAEDPRNPNATKGDF